MEDIEKAQKLEKLEKSVYAVYNALFNSESEEGKDARADVSKDTDARVAEIEKVFEKIASKAITLKENSILEKELADAKAEIADLKMKYAPEEGNGIVVEPVAELTPEPAPNPVPVEPVVETPVTDPTAQ